MTWPTPILRNFEVDLTSPNSDDPYHHGSYNALLVYLFPVDSPFGVAPLWDKLSSEYNMTFEVRRRRNTLLFIDLKPYSYLQSPPARAGADALVRARLTALSPHCPLSTVYGISIMGTRLRFYCKDRNEAITPPSIPRGANDFNDVPPEDQWDCDILSAEGERRLREIAELLKQGYMKLESD